MKCVKCVVSGRVQGVFYRQSTLRQAKQLGINGWVRNLANGDVEVLACGDAEVVEEFEAWLWRGPVNAKVTEVETVEVNQTPPKDFSVKY